jgi:hypothetical protein
MKKLKREKGWLMATGLMGIDKTMRTLAWSGLTLPQLEYMSRRLAVVRICHHVYNEGLNRSKLKPLDYNNPKSPVLIIADSTLSQLATPDDHYPPHLVWLRDVLNWIPDRAGMRVFPWAAPFLGETRTPEEWHALTSDFIRDLNLKFKAEKQAKRFKGDKSRRDSKSWVMDVKKFEIISSDSSRDYRWWKKKEMRAASACLHAVSQLCQGRIKALPKFDKETLKYVRKSDLRKLPEIIRRSNLAKLEQRNIHEAAAKELEAKLAETEFQAANIREKLLKARRILRKK